MRPDQRRRLWIVGLLRGVGDPGLGRFPGSRLGLSAPRGHILHDYIEARVMPSIVGPVGRGDMQYATMWKSAGPPSGQLS